MLDFCNGGWIDVIHFKLDPFDGYRRVSKHCFTVVMSSKQYIWCCTLSHHQQQIVKKFAFVQIQAHQGYFIFPYMLWILILDTCYILDIFHLFSTRNLFFMILSRLLCTSKCCKITYFCRAKSNKIWNVFQCPSIILSHTDLSISIYAGSR